MLARILVLYFLTTSLVSAASITYSSSWHYYNGPAYPSNLKVTETFLTFTGSAVQSGIQLYDQGYDEITFTFNYGGQQLTLDIDESQATITDIYPGVGTSIYLIGIESESIPGVDSTWMFSVYLDDWPGVDGPFTDMTIVDMNNYSRRINGFNYGNGELKWTEVGTVPLPGALWLFGSGFIGLIYISRKNYHG
jgi:hypothetical protein